MKCPITGKRSRPELGDDGTMDTVVYCSSCGREHRYNPEANTDRQRIDQAFSMFREDHEDEDRS